MQEVKINKLEHIKRLSYVANTADSPYFFRFLDEYENRDDTFTYFLGNFIWWPDSYDKLKKVIKLVEAKKASCILWRSEFLFMIAYWLHKHWRWYLADIFRQKKENLQQSTWEFAYNEFFNKNHWIDIITSITQWIERDYWKQNIDERIWNICEFLLKKCYLCNVDLNKNFLCAWWIPIYPTWEPAWDWVWNSENYSRWIRYVLDLYWNLIDLDLGTIDKLLFFWSEKMKDAFLYVMAFNNGVNPLDTIWKFDKYNRLFSPMEYTDTLYEKSDKVFETLKANLKEEWYNRLICWNRPNLSDDFPYLNSSYARHYYPHLLRINRNHISIKDDSNYFWQNKNFWYVFIERGSNDILQIWDVYKRFKVKYKNWEDHKLYLNLKLYE